MYQIATFCTLWLQYMVASYSARHLLNILQWLVQIFQAGMCFMLAFEGLHVGIALSAGAFSLEHSALLEPVIALTDDADVYIFQNAFVVALILAGWLSWYVFLLRSFWRGSTADVWAAVVLMGLAAYYYPGVEALAGAGLQSSWKSPWESPWFWGKIAAAIESLKRSQAYILGLLSGGSPRPSPSSDKTFTDNMNNIYKYVYESGKRWWGENLDEDVMWWMNFFGEVSQTTPTPPARTVTVNLH
ncbi:hypothetical protein PGQ11_010295 [Apiospora arundinis]|uniref:Uncharacterized protein n=1 Tax=Apiospora arundinis TaxID=335852 RepID=A0ABR2I9E4_9PEZI